MGKWWKCRTCHAFNVKGKMECGWCSANFMQQPVSTPQNPVHSQDCIPPKGSGKKSWQSGSYGSYWNQWPVQSGQSLSSSQSNQAVGKGRGTTRSPSVGSQQTSIVSVSKLNQSQSPASSGNFWQRRKLNNQMGSSVDQVESVNGDAKDVDIDAASLMEKMDTLQAMINSLKNRTDPSSLEMRQGLEKELQNLRIQKTSLKSLSDQALVLESLIQRRQNSLEEAERVLMEQTLSRDQVKQELEDAKVQLQSVLEQKAVEDAARFPNGQKQVATGDVFQSAQEMASMLPSDKASVFVECLGLLAQFMKQNSQSNADKDKGQMDVEENGGSSAPSTDFPQVPTMPFAAAPTTPGGAVSDPYGGGRAGSPPRKGRARSLEASPTQARSRSFSGRGKRLMGKQSIPGEQDHHFSRREEAPLDFKG